MVIIDGLIALGIVIVFGYLILMRYMKVNPNAGDFVRDLFGMNTASKIKEMKDKIQQVHDEKRTML